MEGIWGFDRGFIFNHYIAIYSNCSWNHETLRFVIGMQMRPVSYQNNLIFSGSKEVESSMIFTRGKVLITEPLPEKKGRHALLFETLYILHFAGIFYVSV